jgi:hypothetical protein
VVCDGPIRRQTERPRVRAGCGAIFRGDSRTVGVVCGSGAVTFGNRDSSFALAFGPSARSVTAGQSRLATDGAVVCGHGRAVGVVSNCGAIRSATAGPWFAAIAKLSAWSVTEGLSRPVASGPSCTAAAEPSAWSVTSGGAVPSGDGGGNVRGSCWAVLRGRRGPRSATVSYGRAVVGSDSRAVNVAGDGWAVSFGDDPPLDRLRVW